MTTLDDKPSFGKRGKIPYGRIVLTVLIFWVAVIYWYGKTLKKGSRALEVKVEDYLELAQNGKIAEAWVKGDILEADLTSPHIYRDREFKKVLVVLPDRYLRDPGAMDELAAGLTDPGSFHREKGYVNPLRRFHIDVVLLAAGSSILALWVHYFGYRHSRIRNVREADMQGLKDGK